MRTKSILACSPFNRRWNSVIAIVFLCMLPLAAQVSPAVSPEKPAAVTGQAGSSAAGKAKTDAVKLPKAAPNPPAKAPTKVAKPAQAAKKVPPKSAKEQKGLADSENIELANGEQVPVAEVVPRTDAAQKQLQQIFTKLGSTAVEPLFASLNDLNAKVDASLQDSQYVIKVSRSPLQLTEPRVAWVRYRSELDSLNTTATLDATTLEGLRKEARGMSESWGAMANAAVATQLPADLMQRIESVQQGAESTRAALREQAGRLITLQVQISETRVKIEDVIQQIDAADAALRNQLFVLDSPPIWASLHTGTFADTSQHVRIYLGSVVSRSLEFLSLYRYKLLLYGLFWLGILAMLVRVSKQDLSGENTGIDASYLASLQHAYAIALLLALGLFGIAFPKVPNELQRIVRLLSTVPVLFIGFSFVDRRLRPFLVGISVFYVVNLLTLQLIAGTLLRRIVVLLLSISMLAGLTYLLRKGGLLRAFFVERQMTFMHLCCIVSAFLLLGATFANIVGNMSMADWLTNGTIAGLYWAFGLYVFCAVCTALTAAFTASPLAKRSRALRLYSELVNRKVAFYWRVLSWAIWVFVVLVNFQMSTEALAAGRAVLHYKWQLGAISLSPFDIVLFGLVLIVSSMIAKFTRFMLDEEILPRTSLDSGAAQAGSRLTYSGMLIMGGVLALAAAGLELSKLTLLTGALGVGLGFGLQNLVGNFVSGLIISLERPMKIGDMVEAGTLLGEVTTIGFRSSTVRTVEGADVIVPNSEFITKSFVNWSLKDKVRRTDIQIGVAYGTDPNRVLEILTRIVNGHAGVLHTFAPLITFDQFGDSSLIFTVRFWSKLEGRLQVRSALNALISDEFTRNEIVIPFPQRDVNLKIEGGISSLAPPLQEAAKTAVAPQAAK